MYLLGGAMVLKSYKIAIGRGPLGQGPNAATTKLPKGITLSTRKRAEADSISLCTSPIPTHSIVSAQRNLEKIQAVMLKSTVFKTGSAG
jgi:hypothetical protein